MNMQNMTVMFDTNAKQLLETFTLVREMLSRCNVTDDYAIRLHVLIDPPHLYIPDNYIPVAINNASPATVKEDAAQDPYRDQLEVVTRDELSSLLNQYAGKHPGKTKAARDVLGSFGGTRLSDVAEEDWPKIAQTLRAYIEAH